jgi:hypothetical protein
MLSLGLNRKGGDKKDQMDLDMDIDLAQEEDIMDKMVVELVLDGSSGTEDRRVMELVEEEHLVEQVQTGTWDVGEQARGLKRKRGKKDKVYNWTRYLSSCGRKRQTDKHQYT